MSSPSEMVIPIALTAVLAGSVVAVSTTTTRVPDTSAIVSIWSDFVWDVDAVGLTVTRIGPLQEAQIGNAIAHDIESQTFPADPTDTAYVTAVGETIADAVGKLPFPYRFHLIRSNSVNAFAIPGGHVFVTTAMLAELRSEAELAAIIGHEVSHIALRHCIGNLQYELFVQRIAGDDIAAIVHILRRLVAATYDVGQETDADLNGVLLASKAGYDPGAELEVLAILLRIEGGDHVPSRQTVIGEVFGSIGGMLTDLARTHPDTAQRIADAQAIVARNDSKWRGQRFYAGVRNFTERTPRRDAEFEDEWSVYR
jgi:beta-barrel assembly-enhancing protease